MNKTHILLIKTKGHKLYTKMRFVCDPYVVGCFTLRVMCIMYVLCTLVDSALSCEIFYHCWNTCGIIIVFYHIGSQNSHWWWESIAVWQCMGWNIRIIHWRACILSIRKINFLFGMASYLYMARYRHAQWQGCSVQARTIYKHYTSNPISTSYFFASDVLLQTMLWD